LIAEFLLNSVEDGVSRAPFPLDVVKQESSNLFDIGNRLFVRSRGQGPRENAAQPRMLGRIAKHQEFAERPYEADFWLRICGDARRPALRAARIAERKGFSLKAFRKTGITSHPAENRRVGCCENQINDAFLHSLKAAPRLIR
jgi:hypothetical protein